MSITADQLQSLTESSSVYNGSDKIGKIGQIYLDDTSGEPTWVTVKTGLFGSGETFVPLHQAQLDGQDLRVDYDEDTIKGAPRVDADGQISPEEENELYRYYQLDDSHDTTLTSGQDTGTAGADTTQADTTTATDTTQADATAAPVGAGTDGPDADTYDTNAHDAGTYDAGRDDIAGDGRPDAHHAERRDRSDEADVVGQDTSGPTTDDAMTRSEERLNVGTATRESGKARLRKYVTTEQVTQTVPVRHEEVTLEREPITEANQAVASSGPEISEEEHEVTLHEEVPVVEKDVVAVERVKLGTETVTEDAAVTEEVRKENIDMVEPSNTDQS